MIPARPLKLCLLLRYFTVGGLERVVIALANSYVARGIDVRVVVLSTGKRNSLVTELDPRVDIRLLSGSRSEKVTALRELTRDRLVHVHFGDGHTHSLFRAALAGRSVVVTYHSVYTHKRTWWHNRIDQFWASRASAIIAVSAAVKTFCTDEVGIPADRVTVIPNGIEPRARDARPRDTNGGLEALSLSSLYPHKNHGVLLGGVAAARRGGTDVRLRMVGDGPSMAALYRSCIDLGLRDAVDWYGAVWRRDIVEPLLASADVFVSGSRFEGLPLSVLEGMAYGLPLVLSDIPPHREAAGDAALYFGCDDPKGLASALCTLAEDRTLRERLQRASRKRLERFDFDRYVDAHLAVYQQAAA
jgi:glycosyltransferase involved in cell wall biosynthesis